MLDRIGSNIYIYLARTPEIGQGLGRILSCGARKPEQTYTNFIIFGFDIFKLYEFCI